MWSSHAWRKKEFGKYQDNIFHDRDLIKSTDKMSKERGLIVGEASHSNNVKVSVVLKTTTITAITQHQNPERQAKVNVATLNHSRRTAEVKTRCWRVKAWTGQFLDLSL
jgi:transglutaminase/protease-like cytokinesis protein 3